MNSIPAFRRHCTRGRALVLLLLVTACSQATGGATGGTVAPPATMPVPVTVTAPPPAPAPAPSTPPLQRGSTNGDSIIDSIISVYPIDRASWGIEVFDPATMRLLYRHSAERHFIPASNTKIVATSAALALLGPDWRYHTAVHATGGTTGSVENVIVVGRGDPTMSARFFANDFAVLNALADSVARAGVRRITRGVVIDASYFDDMFVHPVWEVGDLRSSDAAPVAAFVIGEGSFGAVVRPGRAVGATANVRVLGPPGLVRVRSEILTEVTDGRTSINQRLAGDTIVFTGTIAFNSPADTEYVALVDPVAYAGNAFVAALRERSIDVAGGVRIVYDTTEARRLPYMPNTRRIAEWESPPMREIVAALMKPSANWMTEQVCKTLGAERNGRGSWQSCVRVEAPFLLSAGIDSTAFLLRDGSGLAAQNLLTPHAIVQLLEYDRRAAWGDDYRRGLPEPGEKGTLIRRLLPLKGRLWAKTGSITNVNSLSGYIQTDSGKMLIFSILSNGSGRPAAEIRNATDAIVMRITRAW